MSKGSPPKNTHFSLFGKRFEQVDRSAAKPKATSDTPLTLESALKELGVVVLADTKSADLNEILDSLSARSRRVLMKNHAVLLLFQESAAPSKISQSNQLLSDMLTAKEQQQRLEEKTQLLEKKLDFAFQAVNNTDIDDTQIPELFDFLGKGLRYAIDRSQETLFNHRIDHHTLAIGRKRLESTDVYRVAMGIGELVCLKISDYQGYFLRDSPFDTLELTLIRLHLFFLASAQEKQQWHQFVVGLNGAFETEFHTRRANNEGKATSDNKESVKQHLSQNFHKLLQSALKDSLTNAYNRNKTRDVLNHYCESDERFAVILIDIDFFKKINDTYGHLSGDKVLVQVARRLSQSVRKGDVVSRWGGEEFLLIIHCTDTATMMAERIRETIQMTPFDIDDGQRIDVTISVGVAEFKSGDTPDSLIDRCDQLLYQAKQTGRNRVCTILNQSFQMH